MAVTKRVLMIDPDIEAVAFVRQAFMAWDEPVEFDHVESAETAFTHLRGVEGEARFSPHLVITELELPGKSGLDMLVELKGDRDLVHIPIAVYTDSQDSETISRAYQLKVNCCVPKPSNPDKVPNLVKDLRHFFLKAGAEIKGNPLLDALQNPAKKKKVTEAFVELEKKSSHDQGKTGAERREYLRANTKTLSVRTRPYNSVDIGKIIKALSQPEPDLDKLVTVEDSDSPIRLACLDISAGGIGTEAHPDLIGGNGMDRGTHLAMLIEMPEGPTPIRAVGQVMWSRRVRNNLHKVGLMFLAISNRDRERIQKYVEIKIS